MSKKNSGEFLFCSPSELDSSVQEATIDLLPLKSKEIYDGTYKAYTKWIKKHSIKLSTEAVLITYFKELCEKYKPSSLVATYSMLKRTIGLNEKINIGTYTQLTALLKKKTIGYQTKKATGFTPEQVNKFLTEAPDDEYLVIKVALIFGVCGSCQKHDLANVKFHNIKEKDDLFVIDLPVRKGSKCRSFTIGGEFRDIVKKFKDLRPKHTETDRFFLNYRNRKCTIQVIGVNKFSKMPRQIATYLKLPNPESYTGHSFRRSSAALIAGSGAIYTTLRHISSSNSNTIKEEEYQEESVEITEEIYDDLMSTINSSPNSADDTDHDSDSQSSKRQKIEDTADVEPSTSKENSTSSNA